MDNQLFRVNGRGHSCLTKCLELVAFQQNRSPEKPHIEGWRLDPEKGFILYWMPNKNGATPFPTPLTMSDAADVIWRWLNSPQAEEFECVAEDESDYDHDGSNERGFVVYVENWGHIGDDEYAECAVRPAYLWFGK